MLVRNSSLAMDSYSEYQRSQQNVMVTLENGRIADDGSNPARRLAASIETLQESVQVRISSYARSLLDNENSRPVPTPTMRDLPASDRDDESLMNSADSRMLILKKLLEAMTGKSFDIPAFQQPDTEAVTSFTPPASPNSNSGGNDQRTQVALNLVQEYQYTEVSIGGRIDLADGSSIELSMSITMERSYQQTAFSVLQERGMLKDPLAISLNGQAVSLSSSATFEFDMNSDGEMELFASLNTNAAFISLDLNADGIVNNGSELFGASSGNGFADLRNYDEDGNGFIDSGDSVFDKLLAWNPSSGLLGSLKDLGVGALYTQAVDSPFKLNDAANRNLGVIRSSGFYLNEDKSAGLLQQVDLRS